MSAKDISAAAQRLSDTLVEIPVGVRPEMKVPARIFADDALWGQISQDRSIEQLTNVATLPGVTKAAYSMPDTHEGYGFPVGGVAAFRTKDGVISPGGVGYDINCGVRLLTSELSLPEVRTYLPDLVHELSRSIPAGAGRDSHFGMSDAELDRVFVEGCRFLVERGMATEADLEHTESGGCLPGAEPSRVSARARKRGSGQLGTMGSGNHFVEVQRVERILNEESASAFGLAPDQVAVLIHTGSRGLGHQVCTDYVSEMDRAMPRYGIHLPDRQLACAPFESPEGQAYFGAMCAAANYAWCNRQVITHVVRDAFRGVLGADAALRLVYDVAHNIAKVETYDGESLCVHRKGATRAFGPANPETPEAYRSVGQPVFIPGSMGTASYVLAGRDAALERSFGSACHGAGRRMSRRQASKLKHGAQVRDELTEMGIVVRSPSLRGLAEEAPHAYKDVDRVVGVVERAGLGTIVARMVPLGVVKG